MTNKPDLLWESIADAWDRWSPTTRAWFYAGTERLMAMVQLKEGDRILDVAAGNGDQTIDFARRVGPNGHVIAVDISEAILRRAADNLTKEKITNASVRVMDAAQLDFPGDHFDVVLSRAGLPYFAEQEKAVREMYRVLKPGGRIGTLGFTTPEKNAFFAVPISIVRRHANLPPLAVGQPGPFSLSAPGALVALFEKCGFRDVVVESFPSSLCNESAATHLRMLRESWPVLHQMMASFSDEQKEKCWADIGTALEEFESANGLSMPSEFSLLSATK